MAVKSLASACVAYLTFFARVNQSVSTQKNWSRVKHSVKHMKNNTHAVCMAVFGRRRCYHHNSILCYDSEKSFRRQWNRKRNLTGQQSTYTLSTCTTVHDECSSIFCRRPSSQCSQLSGLFSFLHTISALVQKERPKWMTDCLSWAWIEVNKFNDHSLLSTKS